MLPKKTVPAKKSPPRTKQATKKAASVDDLTDDMEKLNVKSDFKSFSMDMKCPFILYCHTVDKRKHFTIELWAPTMPQKYYHPRLDPNDPTMLLFGINVPMMIATDHRLNVVHDGDAAFNDDTHRNTSFKALAHEINEAFTDQEKGEEQPSTFIGKARQIRLPFACKKTIL
jgi:hypothetical protein